MAAQEDSLLSPITAAADRSESTTLLVAKITYTVTAHLNTSSLSFMDADATGIWPGWWAWCRGVGTRIRLGSAST